MHEIWCGIHLVYVCALTLAMSEETPKEVVKQEEEKPASEPQQQASEDKPAAPEVAAAAEKPEEVNGSNSGLFAYAAHVSSNPVTLVLLYCL